MSEIVPFRVAIPDSELLDLRWRLARTRWPEPEPVADWSQGVPLSYLQELCRYWAESYNWRLVEARLNASPQYRTEIDGLSIHFLHARSSHPDAFPIIITHGWPGSVVEFLKVIPILTDPGRFKGGPLDAFHVVCPSPPGYGFSDKPSEPGWGIDPIAHAWNVLMARLGYDRFGAVGGDWGTSISTIMGQQNSGHVAGIHLLPPLAAPDPDTLGYLTDAERASLEDLQRAQDWEDGYSAEQATRPQTLGYSLVDSPIGLCAWIVEKFRAWTDCDGHPVNALSRDEMLDDVTLYWLTRSGASAARMYWESIRSVQQLFQKPSGDVVAVPTGCSIFPRENPRPSRRWAEKRFVDIRYWNELERGGHFAAFEQPELFAAEVRNFFRLVR